MSETIERASRLTELLNEAIDGWPEFDTNEPVNGGDFVSWFGSWRRQLRAELAQQKETEATAAKALEDVMGWWTRAALDDGDDDIPASVFDAAMAAIAKAKGGAK